MSKEQVIWQGEYFNKIRKFDCLVVDLERFGGGGYFTSIPISSLDFRKKCPHSKARVEIRDKKDVTEFIIFDDWGTSYQMVIPNSMTKEIETARKSAIKNELLK